MAALPDETVKQVLERGMQQYTPQTIQSSEIFFRDIRQTREQGFSISEQEYEEGINAVASPILDPDGRPIAAITVAGPAYRLLREQMNEIGPVLVATAREIAQEINMQAMPD
jgi:DNA-binding IclR family transcriptional regulator